MPELYSANKPKPNSSEEKNPPPFSPENVSKRKVISRDFLPNPRGHSFSSYMIAPSSNIRFETQEPEEEILMILRAHWITNVPWVVIAGLLVWAPVLLRFFPLLVSFPVRFQIMFVVIWYLVVLLYVFEKFLSWFFNMTLITDERIVDVDFVNLTTKKISDADLDKIQDVSYTNAGAIGTIFDYGNVMVQTAAEVAEFVFEKVPHPSEVAKILQRLRTEEKIEAIEGRVR